MSPASGHDEGDRRIGGVVAAPARRRRYREGDHAGASVQHSVGMTGAGGSSVGGVARRCRKDLKNRRFAFKNPQSRGRKKYEKSACCIEVVAV